ncbi:hypothetical protein T459_02421 [Capsicum annuum]|uniref:Putative plant transposon protein domain-containing protein n=1 Tax=Capsicum annuum TaxID=4072 RepID=A0A2G3AJY9_CAPAN|nr:hypothetical protein T459_02421 [Capsicum annuum]
MRENYGPLLIGTWKFTTMRWYHASTLEMDKCQVGLWCDALGSRTLTAIRQMGDWPTPRCAKGMSPRKNLPRDARKGNTPDKGKEKATFGRVIAKGLPPWANGVGQIKTRDHSVQAKHWLGFVDNHLLPSRNDQDIMIDRDIIVECIMDKITINLGELIVEMMKLRSK